MYECFGGLKPSECECMNCVNGCDNNWCLGTAFTSERYSHKNKLKDQTRNYCKFFFHFLLTCVIEWDVIRMV